MSINEKLNAPWTRKHDVPGIPHLPSVAKIQFPQGLKDLIDICKDRRPGEFLKAGGSHWALSDAAISDKVFIETNDPRGEFPAMDKTLFNVVPGCLSNEFIEVLNKITIDAYDTENHKENHGAYLVHVETGKKVYQLYSELDIDFDFKNTAGISTLADVLRDKGNASYAGPWAFSTLGGAGGQTVFGALTTGTHGGDFTLPPIADSVMAMHLVADGGKHFWIERDNLRPFFDTDAPLTDEDKLNKLFKQNEFGGVDNFRVIRDSKLFNAVLVSAGRFGIVYSIVLKAVRQYNLHENRELGKWNEIKSLIADPNSSLFKLPGGADSSKFQNRFLQIAVSVTPNSNFQENLCGITKRWNVPLTPAQIANGPHGRKERRGDFESIVSSDTVKFIFKNAGLSYTYSPDPANPEKAKSASFLDIACSYEGFVHGAIQQTYKEIEKLVEENAAVAGGVILAVVAVGAGGTVLVLAAALAIVLLALLALMEWIDSQYGDARFGQVMDEVRHRLLDVDDPELRKAGIFAWQTISNSVFSDQQGALDYEAISYAVMDKHNYTDRSCEKNVDSIEVFFEATDPMLVPYVDALLAFERDQEQEGKAMVGYISLRFTKNTQALIGMEKFERSVAVEVSGLKDVKGTLELIDFATNLARNPNFKGILHWGQRNDHTMDEVQLRFGDSPASPSGPLAEWRKALSSITENGRLDRFSSAFTRRTGLEVVRPIIKSFSSDKVSINTGGSFTVSWNCVENPPATGLTMSIQRPDGPPQLFSDLPLSGSKTITDAKSGTYRVTLLASTTLNMEVRTAEKVVEVSVTDIVN